MQFVLKAVLALIAAFATRGLITTGFQNLMGRRLLESASWVPGTLPPTTYMLSAVVAAILAGVLAGGIAALIVGRARIRHAILFGALFAGLAAWGNRATLAAEPHPYEWPLILAPLVALPLGAWLIVTLRPLRVAT
jgi:hypothetical protein